MPEFALEVAKDPFHADGRTLGYRVIKGGLPNGEDRPVLFYDPGGPDLGVRGQAMYNWFPNPPGTATGGSVRQYRDLARYVAAKNSAKAVDGKVNQANPPGEESKVEEKIEKP